MTVPADTAGLAAALAQAGAPIAPQALEDFLRGVAAAPEGHDPDAWMSLLVPAADSGLRGALRRALAAVRTRTVAVDSTPPLERLRRELSRRGLDGFVVPRADEHQGEFVPRRAERLAWISGFTGSAGTAIVLADRATACSSTAATPCRRRRKPPTGSRRCRSPNAARTRGSRRRSARAPCSATTPGCTRGRSGRRSPTPAGAPRGTLQAVDDNPVDAVWDRQPPRAGRAGDGARGASRGPRRRR